MENSITITKKDADKIKRNLDRMDKGEEMSWDDVDEEDRNPSQHDPDEQR